MCVCSREWVLGWVLGWGLGLESPSYGGALGCFRELTESADEIDYPLHDCSGRVGCAVVFWRSACSAVVCGAEQAAVSVVATGDRGSADFGECDGRAESGSEGEGGQFCQRSD